MKNWHLLMTKPREDERAVGLLAKIVIITDCQLRRLALSTAKPNKTLLVLDKPIIMC